MAAYFGGHYNLFDEFSDDLTFFQVSNFPFCLQPLASHTVETLNHEQIRLQLRNADCGFRNVKSAIAQLQADNSSAVRRDLSKVGRKGFSFQSEPSRGQKDQSRWAGRSER